MSGFLVQRFIPLLSLLLFWCCNPPPENYQDSIAEWQDEIEKFEELDRLEDYPPDSILFAGSSSIRLWDTIAEDMAPYSVIQRGYGGAKLSDFAWYTERIVYPHQFQALVLFVANDIAGTEEDRTPEEVLELFEYIVEVVREKFPVAPIFWIEVTPTESRWDSWPRIQRAGHLIRHFCSRRRNVFFISTAEHFLGPDGLPISDYFQEDQLHLNREGYQLWSTLIKEDLDRVLKRMQYQNFPDVSAQSQ